MPINPGSFKDPNGIVFSRNDNIYRCVFAPGKENFDAARAGGIYDKLIGSGLMIPFEMIDCPDFAPESSVYCLSHPRIPMISYPWEWPFSLLKDAALVHLKAMNLLVSSGFWLRDASAFNVQFTPDGLRLIDTLSVGRKPPDSPWVAYGQFCSHFLAPLAMAAYTDIRMMGLWRNFIDGFPLDMAVNTLPIRKRYRPGLFFHLTLHARFQRTADKKKDIGKSPPKKEAKVSDKGLIGLIHSLQKTVEGIDWKPDSRIWMDYEDIRTYQSNDIKYKSEFVDRMTSRLNPSTVWDLGANTGEFSRIAAANGAMVVSIDGDASCTEHFYKKISDDKIQNILPLTIDLANPSPGLGWDHRERLSLSERGPADLILALALIHHLVFSGCIPLDRIADWFASLAGHLIVEFVPPDDPMVEKLLRHREDGHHPYHLEAFESVFGKRFDFIERKPLPNGRELFFCKRREV